MQCKYFGKCGGCKFQDEYDDQILRKKEFLENLFGIKISIKKGIQWNYRNRMDFVYAFGKLGLREVGTWKWVVDIDECPIASKEINNELKKVRSRIKDKIESYDFIHHKGYLRYVVIRSGYFTKDVLTNFVVAKKETFDYDGKHVFSLNDTMSDTSQGKVFTEVQFLTEKFGDITYFIHPNAFFQTNSFMAKQMYNEIKKFAEGKVIDLFAGIGSIGIYISDSVNEVKAVELNPDSLISAKKTMEFNGISNVEFEIGDARKIKFGDYDTVILDPPRGGVGKKLMNKLKDAKKIIYLSCNPKTQKEDISYLENHKIEYQLAFDAFPNTPHVENLLVLTT